ncbi:hypothetical protein HPB51_014640 [Rhipicephalus microplus]|uniref:Uncharacterized protein n=1 Tax=Rhipicephalus microplus TaxID=6941 RepID=A0A9J6F4E7_RHIMP|nr:hypothetical protein HPB51_014640 [Rhipicephalus microplus]
MASWRRAQCRTVVSASENDVNRVVAPAPLDGYTSSTVASELGSELTPDEKSEQYDNFDEQRGLRRVLFDRAVYMGVTQPSTATHWRGLQDRSVCERLVWSPYREFMRSLRTIPSTLRAKFDSALQGLPGLGMVWTRVVQHTHGPVAFRLYRNVTAVAGIEPATFGSAADLVINRGGLRHSLHAPSGKEKEIMHKGEAAPRMRKELINQPA